MIYCSPEEALAEFQNFCYDTFEEKAQAIL
jgi:hypothetical protein